jgi:hypothetical protein
MTFSMENAMQSTTDGRPEQTDSRSPVSAGWLASEGKAAVGLGLVFLAMDVPDGVSTPYDYARIASDLLILAYGVVAWRVPPPGGVLASAAWCLLVGLAWPFMPTLAKASGQPVTAPLGWVAAGIGLIGAGAWRLRMYRRMTHGLGPGAPKN